MPGPRTLPWIRRAPGAPYFVTEAGQAWMPIGQNDAVTWVEFAGLLDRRDLDGVREHLRRGFCRRSIGRGSGAGAWRWLVTIRRWR